MFVIQLAWKDVQSLVRRKPWLFILLLTGFIAANYFALHASTIILGDLNAFVQNPQYLARIVVDCSVDMPYVNALTILHKIQNDQSKEDIVFYFYGNVGDTKEKEFSVVAVNSIKQELSNMEFGIREGGYLSIDDVDNGFQNCIVTAGLLDYSKPVQHIGNRIQIGHLNHRIVGVFRNEIFRCPIHDDNGNQIVVPVLSLQDQELPLYAIEITGLNPFQEDWIITLNDCINEFAPNAQIIMPESITRTTAWMNAVYGIVIQILILMLAFINLMTILLAWLYENQKTLYTIYICGGYSKTLYQIIALDIFIMDAFALVPAYLVFVWTKQLRVWGTMNELPYVQLIVISVVVMAILIAFAIGYSARFVRNLVKEGGASA